MQLSQQARALGRVEAVDELLGSPRRVERLHGLLQRVCTQVAPRHRHSGAGRAVVTQTGTGQPGAGSQGEGGS